MTYKIIVTDHAGFPSDDFKAIQSLQFDNRFDAIAIAKAFLSSYLPWNKQNNKTPTVKVFALLETFCFSL